MRHYGFTLVELLVTMAIVVMIISAGVSIAISNINRNKITAAGEEVQETLRQARNNAQAGVIDCSVCTCTPAQTTILNGWQVSFAAGSYTMAGSCGVTPTLFSSRTTTLASGITFSPVPSAIIFKPLGQGTNIVGTQTITLTGFNTTVGTTVSSSGQIVTVATPTSGPTNTPTRTPTPTTASAPTATPTRTPTPTPVGATPTPVIYIATPSEDTRVQQDTATTNYSSSTYIRANNGSTNNARSFVKFSLVGKAGTVQSASLKLWINSAASSGTANTHLIKGMSDVSWSEGSVTWNVQPAMGSQIGTLPVPVGGAAAAAGTMIEATLDTAYVQSKMGQVMGIVLDYCTTGGAGCASSDSANYDAQNGPNPPQLVVTYN